MSILSLIVALCFICLILYIINYLLAVPPPITMILNIAVAIILLFMLLSLFVPLGSLGSTHVGR
jgi:hypothetical protein